MINFLSIIALPFIISFILSILLINIRDDRIRFGRDLDTGPQKIHTMRAYRLGGAILALNLLIFIIYIDVYYYLFSIGLIFLLPVFMIGLIEDLTHNTSILSRYFFCLITGFLLILYTGVSIKEVDIQLLNEYFKYSYVPLIFTALGLSIIPNAWNFIDGLNGLASGLGFSALFFLSLMAKEVGLFQISLLSLILSASIFGFFLVNFFSGKIFLGDSGSYFIGILVGWFGVIISSEQNQISPWAIFLLILYPATDLILSSLRRVLSLRSPTRADNLHLHTLIYRLMILKLPYLKKPIINSFSGLLVFLLGLTPMISCYQVNYQYPYVLNLCLFFFIFYIIIYYCLYFYILIINKNSPII